MAWITKKLFFHSWHRQEIYLVSKTSWPAVGLIQPATQSLSGGSSPVLKWPKREANCLPPSSDKLKNEWSYISPDPYAFMVRTEATLYICILLSTEISCVSSVAPVSKKDERLHPSLCCVMLNTSTCHKTWRWVCTFLPKVDTGSGEMPVKLCLCSLPASIATWICAGDGGSASWLTSALNTVKFLSLFRRI